MNLGHGGLFSSSSEPGFKNDVAGISYLDMCTPHGGWKLEETKGGER